MRENINTQRYATILLFLIFLLAGVAFTLYGYFYNMFHMLLVGVFMFIVSSVFLLIVLIGLVIIHVFCS